MTESSTNKESETDSKIIVKKEKNPFPKNTPEYYKWIVENNRKKQQIYYKKYISSLTPEQKLKRKEKKREYMREYKKTHNSESDIQRSERYNKNKEKNRERQRLYYRTHREKFAAARKERRELIKRLLSEHELSLRAEEQDNQIEKKRLQENSSKAEIDKPSEKKRLQEIDKPIFNDSLIIKINGRETIGKQTDSETQKENIKVETEINGI